MPTPRTSILSVSPGLPPSMQTGPAIVVSICIASAEELGPSYVAKRSFVSITNGSPNWTWRTGGFLALKLVQSWSLVALFMPVSPLLYGRPRQAWRSRKRSYGPTGTGIPGIFVRIRPTGDQVVQYHAH